MRICVLMFFAVLLAATEARALTCDGFSSCEEAVLAWCTGMHPRADGDNDGIPCENVCPNRETVAAHRAKHRLLALREAELRRSSPSPPGGEGSGEGGEQGG